ncbi:MAG: aldose 1-epimerase [bacterium]|nr:aldose 1-epimerase [bacterium]
MGSEYEAREEDFGGKTMYVLEDRARGCRVCVLPSVGNNCIGFQVMGQSGPVEVLHAPENPEMLWGRPSGYGIPILFPWPNRVEAGRFVFDGKVFQLDLPGDRPHVLHGFVLNRPWTVVGCGADDEGAWVESLFQSTNFPEVGWQFPFPFEVRAIHRVVDGVLVLTVEGTNVGSDDMPAGLGIHPYFALPLVPEGSREDCIVQVPAETYWPLREDCIPTGDVLPVAGRFDLREETRLADRVYDHVWSGVVRSGGWSRSLYTDPTAGLRVTMAADAVFRELVLYAPEDRPVLCLEPYTCVTNALNLEVQGIDAGLVRLKPGEMLRGTMRVEVNPES